jgi:hypothetical protein
MSATTQERFFWRHDTAPRTGLILGVVVGCTLLRFLFWKPSCIGSSFFLLGRAARPVWDM